jgi:hypothetical protein
LQPKLTHSSISHSCQKVETTQVFHQRIDKIWYGENEVSFKLKKKGNSIRDEKAGRLQVLAWA